ncbi:MAG: hypothetical protein VB949_01855 [Pseudomonadales bacterium]
MIGVLSGDDADERRKRALIGAGVGALASVRWRVRRWAPTWMPRRTSFANNLPAPA